MTDNNGSDQVPSDLRSDNHTRKELVGLAEELGVTTKSKDTKGQIIAKIDQAQGIIDAASGAEDEVPSDVRSGGYTQKELRVFAEKLGVTTKVRDTKSLIVAKIEQAQVILASRSKVVDSDDSDDQADNIDVDPQWIDDDQTPGSSVFTEDTDDSEDSDDAGDSVGESTEETPAVAVGDHLPEDYDDDDQADNIEVDPQWIDDDQTPGHTVFTDEASQSTDRVGFAGRFKASVPRRGLNIGNMFASVKSKVKGKVDFRDKRTWVVIASIVIAIALVAAYLAVNLSDSDNGGDDIVTPAVEVDDAFAGLCETDEDVDLTAMPTSGFQLDAGEVSNDDAATVQSRVVDSYFADTALGCSPQGIEFLRSGVDQERIDANRAGLDTRDSAGRIAYNGEHPDEAAVLAEYLQGVMSDCASEMVVLTEADIQDGLYVLTFTDASYSDTVWVKLPVETALSGVDSIEVMRCTIGLVEGADGLTRYFMYSEAFGTFVSVEKPFGNTVEYVPAAVEETGTAPVVTTDEADAPEVVAEEQADAVEDAAPEVDEPQPMPTPEVEKAETPAETPKPKPQPKPKPKPETTEQVKPETNDTSEDQTNTDTNEESEDTAQPETPAEDTEQTTVGQPETPAEDGTQAPAVPVDAGDQGTIPGSGGCNGTCGGPNPDGSQGNGPGDAPGNGGSGGCVGVCVGQGGDTGGGDDGPGGTDGGCNVDCPGPGDTPTDPPVDEPVDDPVDEPEDEPVDDPEDDECVAPNTLDAFGNCKAPPRGGAVDL